MKRKAGSKSKSRQKSPSRGRAGVARTRKASYGTELRDISQKSVHSDAQTDRKNKQGVTQMEPMQEGTSHHVVATQSYYKTQQLDQLPSKNDKANKTAYDEPNNLLSPPMANKREERRKNSKSGLNAFYGNGQSRSRSRSGMREQVSQVNAQPFLSPSLAKGMSRDFDDRSIGALSAQPAGKPSQKKISLAGISGHSDLKQKYQQIARNKSRSRFDTVLDDNTDVNKQYFGADEIQILGSPTGTAADNQSTSKSNHQMRSMLELGVPRVNLVMANSRVTPDNQPANNSTEMAQERSRQSKINEQGKLNIRNVAAVDNENGKKECGQRDKMEADSHRLRDEQSPRVRNPFKNGDDKNLAIYQKESELTDNGFQQDPAPDFIHKNGMDVKDRPDTPIDELFTPFGQDPIHMNHRETRTLEELKVDAYGRQIDEFGIHGKGTERSQPDLNQRQRQTFQLARSQTMNDMKGKKSEVPEEYRNLNQSMQDKGMKSPITRDTFGELDDVSENTTALMARLDAELQSVHTATVSASAIPDAEMEKRLIQAEATIQKLQKQNEQLTQNMSKVSSQQNIQKSPRGTIDNILIDKQGTGIFDDQPRDSNPALDNMSLQSLVDNFCVEPNSKQKQMSFNQPENKEARDAGTTPVGQSVPQTPAGEEEDQIPDDIDEQYIYHVKDLIKMLRTPPFHKENVKMRKKLAQLGIDISSNETYINKVRVFLSCHENYLKRKREALKQSPQTDLALIQPSISTQLIIDYYSDMANHFNSQAGKLKSLYQQGAATFKNDLDSYYGGINQSRHAYSLNQSGTTPGQGNKDGVPQSMRVAPEDIEMQIKFLITLLSNIEEKATEGSKHAHETQSKPHHQKQLSRNSQQFLSIKTDQLRRGRVPTEAATSLASGARDHWPNHPSDALPSPSNNGFQNRSSDPRGFLPGNQIRAPEDRPESLAYGYNAMRYYDQGPATETMLDKLSRVPSKLIDMFLGSPQSESGMNYLAPAPSPAAYWPSNASQQFTPITGNLFEVTIGPHSNFSRPRIDRFAGEDDAPEMDDVIDEEIKAKEHAIKRQFAATTVKPPTTQSTSTAKKFSGTQVLKQHGGPPNVGNIFQQKKDQRSRERLGSIGKSPNRAGTKLKSNSALSNRLVNSASVKGIISQTEHKNRNLNLQSHTMKFREVDQGDKQYDKVRRFDIAREDMNQKHAMMQQSAENASGWTSAQDSYYVAAGIVSPKVKKNTPADLLGLSLEKHNPSFFAKKNSEEDPLIIVNNSLSWCSQEEKQRTTQGQRETKENKQYLNPGTPVAASRRGGIQQRTDSASFRSELSSRSKDRLQKANERFRTQIDKDRASIARASVVQTPGFDKNIMPSISAGLSTPSRNDMSPNSLMRKNIFMSATRQRSANINSRLSGASPIRSDNGDAISQLEQKFISVKEFQLICRQVQGEHFKDNKQAERVAFQDLMPMYRKAYKIVPSPQNCKSDQEFLKKLRDFIQSEFKLRISTLVSQNENTLSTDNQQQFNQSTPFQIKNVKHQSNIGENNRVFNRVSMGQDDLQLRRDSQESKETTRKHEDSSVGMKAWKRDSIDVQTEKKSTSKSKLEFTSLKKPVVQMAQSSTDVARSPFNTGSLLQNAAMKSSLELGQQASLSKYISDSKIDKLSDNQKSNPGGGIKVMRRVLDNDLRDSHNSSLYEDNNMVAPVKQMWTTQGVPQRSDAMTSDWRKTPPSSSPNRKEGSKGDTPKFQRNLFNKTQNSAKYRRNPSPGGAIGL